ncbi:MAG: 50S ribosomal protein L6 [candidate division Zixibacteria bacterium]|nr:50S ribosomal protein L6 [candidate division Zixibacteria bacterium]NIR67703.1 50S ribosomal protein L6 [candidate division Zixibacteria bacterium]NIS16769.1 50S ribosomal protein L6 [candidate division Zixibacteria bacterium]NIS48956.1 50S ribosomal protein L6 [candidate division Zixibacteria bacterium]NIT53172.1 50S ribosomal protein L6 [candidate division Zixibacteria bacterium]
MSRIGKQPIKIPDKVKVEIKNSTVFVKGPKGELTQEIHPQIQVDIEDNVLSVKRPSDSKFFRAQHGLVRALINNMIIGVTDGFSKVLEIVGVGYRAEMAKKMLKLSLGFSHPIYFAAPPGINIDLESQQKIKISGSDKALVGLVAAKIRSFRPPEPYKGKGIKYEDEQIRRKAGKTAA